MKLTLTAVLATIPILASCRASAPPHDDDAAAEDLIERLLSAEPARFADLLASADGHRIKIELAIVVPGPEGPTLERHRFDRGPEYFYPASSVKTCAAIAAVERLRRVAERSGESVGLDTPLRFHPLFEDDVLEESDPSHVADGAITAGHDMRKVFLVSDNGAYNHLYELAGNELVNETMRRAGLTRTRIFHRLSEFRSAPDQLRTPRVDLLDGQRVIASVPERTSPFAETNEDLGGISIGTAHTRGDELVEGPMSFARKNYMALRDLQDMHVMLLRPDVVIPGPEPHPGFELDDVSREFIRGAMAETPGASRDPVYDPAQYPDDYSKFLWPGLLELRAPDELTVRDKVGRAYGFSTTNSEVVDDVTGRSFFLAATIYTNPNGVVGDGVYGYPRADRFFADLGAVLGRYVLER